MKKAKRLLSTLLAAALMCGLVCTTAFAEESEQKIVVGDEVYDRLLAAILSEEEDAPITVRLESDVRLTGTAIVLGTSDYDGAFDGQEVTVASHDITIDLNGFTLSPEEGKAIFEVQDGYTLSIVDSSEAKTGKLGAGDAPIAACVFAPGATIHYMGKTIAPIESTDPSEPDGTTPATPAVTVEDMPAEGTAYASTQNITIDGAAVEFAAYALKDDNGSLTNYVKLRDIAVALNGSEAQFEVGFDGSIFLTTKTAYTGGSDMGTPFSGDREYKGGAQTVKVDGEDVAMTAITLYDENGGGYSYFKLRDLGAVLGFAVGYSNETGISITTTATAE